MSEDHVPTTDARKFDSSDIARLAAHKATIRLRRLVICFLAMLSFLTLASDPAFGQRFIKGISIACSNDHVYTWYSDRTVSVGTSENLSAYQPPHPYSLPFGKTPEDIVEIGIARNDYVYTWYRDLTVSVGTSTDLDKYQPRHPYRVTRTNSSPDGIVGIDIACSNDHVYAWFRTGLVISGTSEYLDKYHDAVLFSTGSLTASSITGIGIARNDHVYAWFFDRRVSSGTSTNLQKYRSRYEYVFGPGPCDISADPPKLRGRTVSSVGIRGPDCKSSAEIVVRLIGIRPGFPDKILITRRLTGTNFEVPVSYSCDGNRQMAVVTEVQTVGRKVKSAEVSIGGCF